MNNEYVFERNQAAQELLRLRLIEEAVDPATVAHLQRTGAGAGWRCLELGAGAGSILKWLASAVGPRGSVVAVDKIRVTSNSSPARTFRSWKGTSSKWRWTATSTWPTVATS